MKVQTPVCNIDKSIFIQAKHLNIIRHEALTFRLPFGGHGIPWKRLKIWPLADCLSSAQKWPVVGSSFGWLIFTLDVYDSIWSLVTTLLHQKNLMIDELFPQHDYEFLYFLFKIWLENIYKYNLRVSLCNCLQCWLRWLWLIFINGPGPTVTCSASGFGLVRLSYQCWPLGGCGGGGDVSVSCYKLQFLQEGYIQPG